MPTEGRGDLRDSLAQIPDLERGEDPATPGAPMDAPISDGLWVDTGDPRVTAAVRSPDPHPTAELAAAPENAARQERPSASNAGSGDPVRARPPMWRRIGFAVLVAALVGAIPVLGGAGYRLVTRSTDGTFSKAGASPFEPGYEELVTSTPTALVVQTNREGDLTAITFLALGSENGGGSIIFLPTDTLINQSTFGIDRLSSPFGLPTSDVQAKVDLVTNTAAGLLNVGIDEVIQLDDQGWEYAVGPVTSFEIDNLDDLEVDGTALPTGPQSLEAEMVGPYLSASRPEESELARIARQEQVWRGWLGAVGASNREDAVPGESSAGLGLFAGTLAEGDVAYEILPGTTVTGAKSGYRPDDAAIANLVAETVPVPDAASPGSRRRVRLLNGVAATPIPLTVTRQVAAIEGTVTVVGNGPSFGRAQTTISFADPANEAYAKIVAKALGATGDISQQPGLSEENDITIVLGRDVLGDVPADTTSVLPADEAGSGSPPQITTAPIGGN